MNLSFSIGRLRINALDLAQEWRFAFAVLVDGRTTTWLDTMEASTAEKIQGKSPQHLGKLWENMGKCTINGGLARWGRSTVNGILQ